MVMFEGPAHNSDGALTDIGEVMKLNKSNILNITQVNIIYTFCHIDKRVIIYLEIQ